MQIWIEMIWLTCRPPPSISRQQKRNKITKVGQEVKPEVLQSGQSCVGGGEADGGDRKVSVWSSQVGVVDLTDKLLLSIQVQALVGVYY